MTTVPGPFGVDEADLTSVLLRDAVALAESIGRTMAITRALIDGGRIVDMSGLDRDIGLLCAMALDLPPDEGRTLRPLLLALRAEVVDLTAAMRSQTDQQ